jgi:membrane associated rhomboid family serine protease
MDVLYPILGATVLVSYLGFQSEKLLQAGMLKPYRVVQGQIHRLITHGFLHADWPHLLFNMLVLWQFGEWTSAHMQENPVPGWIPFSGQQGFLALYFGGMLFAALPALYKHSRNPGYASLGASGAVSAVLMAFIVYFPQAQIAVFFIPMPAVVAGLLFFAYEQYMDRWGKTRIAHDAHLYGALYGVLFALLTDGDSATGLVQAIRETWESFFQ